MADPRAPSPEALARVRRIAAALADELLGEEAPGPVRAAPACAGCGTPNMREVRGGDAIALHQCVFCGAAWVDLEALDRLTETARSEAPPGPPDPTRIRGAVRAVLATVPDTTGYRSCPTCGELMRRKNFGEVSGVIIDECPDHGVFLDRGELEAICRFVAEGGLTLRDQLTREREDTQALRADRDKKFAAADRLRALLSARRWRSGPGLGGLF